jgi:hypothetical protein
MSGANSYNDENADMLMIIAVYALIHGNQSGQRNSR